MSIKNNSDIIDSTRITINEVVKKNNNELAKLKQVKEEENNNIN